MVEPGHWFSNFKLQSLLLKGVSYRNVYETEKVTRFWATRSWCLAAQPFVSVSHAWALQLFLRVRGAGLKTLPEILWSL